MFSKFKVQVCVGLQQSVQIYLSILDNKEEFGIQKEWCTL